MRFRQKVGVPRLDRRIQAWLLREVLLVTGLNANGVPSSQSPVPF